MGGAAAAARAGRAPGGAPAAAAGESAWVDVGELKELAAELKLQDPLWAGSAEQRELTLIAERDEALAQVESGAMGFL